MAGKKITNGHWATAFGLYFQQLKPCASSCRDREAISRDIDDRAGV
jgi:hypothetical protein